MVYNTEPLSFTLDNITFCSTSLSDFHLKDETQYVEACKKFSLLKWGGHNTKCTMKEVLLSIKEKYLQEGESAVEEDNDWYIYEPDDILSLSTPCYIAPRPEFDENEEGIFPEYVIENNMDTQSCRNLWQMLLSML